MAFRIITDSATDMPQEIREKYHLHVIPTPFILNGVDHLDGDEITTEEFYNYLDDDKNVISTYHINAFMFRNAFEPYAKAGDEVLYCCFSTGIAGTYNAANLAKEELLEEYPDFQLTILTEGSERGGAGTGSHDSSQNQRSDLLCVHFVFLHV